MPAEDLIQYLIRPLHCPQLDIVALALDHGRMPAEDLIQYLIRPLHCPQLVEESPAIDLDVYFHHQTLLMAAWFNAAQQVPTGDERSARLRVLGWYLAG